VRANGNAKKEIQNEKAKAQDTEGRNGKGSRALEIRKNTSVIQRKYIIKKNWKNPMQSRQGSIVCARWAASQFTGGFELPFIR